MTYPLTLEFTIQRQIQMNWIELTINSYLKLNSYQKQIKNNSNIKQLFASIV